MDTGSPAGIIKVAKLQSIKVKCGQKRKYVTKTKPVLKININGLSKHGSKTDIQYTF